MSIEKSLYEAPLGMESLVPMEAEIEIEMEPEETTIEVEIAPVTFEQNLIDEMPSSLVEGLSSDVLDFIRNDRDSRRDWEKAYADGIRLLGLKIEQRTEPWDGACGVFHPLLAEAVVRFQSESILATFPASGPVKTQIIGKITREKEEAAARVQEDMNYELTNNMVEYRSEHERLLWSLPLAGSAFKKVYFDPNLNRQVAIFVPAEDIIVPYGASDLESSPRITHRMRKTENEIRKLMVAGFYRDIELPGPELYRTDIDDRKNQETGVTAIKDDRYTIYECHCELDLEGFEDKDENGEKTGIALPYVVTMLSTGEVLAIRRNFLEDDPLRKRRMHFVHYPYIPGFGFYGFGLIHLVGGFAESATSLLRQLVDAGTLSNLPGGFKSKDLRVKNDDTPIAPGEFRDVDVVGGTIRDSILPLPYKEPSATLYQLLGTIVEEGRRFASVADLKISDMSAQSPVGTTLAILERNLKVMSAVQARVHAAMKQEFKLLAGIVRDYTPQEYTYEPEGPRRSKFSDYRHCEVIPVSDPNASTMAQKVVQYQAALQLAQGAPQIYDLPQLHRQMLEVLGIKNVQKIVPLKDDFKPTDPVSENMDIIQGKPVKAFIYQDHEAHLRVHLNAMRDPKMQQIIGQNPMAQQLQAQLMAHVSEHVAFQYRAEIEKMLGVPLPPPESHLPEDIEVDLSRTVAIASDKLLQKDTAEAQQQQAQQQAQDPVLQLQMREQQLKEAEFQHKQQMDQAELNLKMQESQLKNSLENKRIDTQAQVAGAQIGAKKAEAEAKIANDQLLEGVKLGIERVSRQRTGQD
ncbi:hypothetical protein EBT31_01105 [bacterium]|nr:hypothetical protein [bacterium]